MINAGSETQGGDHVEEPVPDQLGKYEIRRRLGAGAMGAVYLAHDPMIDRDVAIKVLPLAVSTDEIALSRFLGEARAAGRLSHPNTISVFDIGEAEGIHYIVMELARGGSVAERLADEKSLSFSEACRLTIEAARGLAAAHDMGLIHRDIKPENLMLDGDGAVKIVDFGLSKSQASETESQAALTAVGQVVGTPHYMSPEQFQAGELDARSDIYSLGATFYRLLTAEFPYGAKSIHQLMYAHLESPPPDPRQHAPNLSDDCAAVLAKSMAKSPDDRYVSMAEFIFDLERLLSGRASSGENSEASLSTVESKTAPSVLVVEPSRLQARIVSDEFNAAGAASLDVVGTADEALRYVDHSTPDLIIAARQLPDLTGEGLYRRLDARPKLDDALFLLVTASDATDAIPESGGRLSLARVEKQAGAADLFRTVHVAGAVELSHELIDSPVDAVACRVLIVTVDGKIPAPLGKSIRSAGLLDISVVPLDQFLGGEASDGDFSLVLALLDAGNLSSTMLRNLRERTNRSGEQPVVLAAGSVDGDTLILRFVSRGAMQVRCRRPLEEDRLTRLVQIV